MMQSQDILCSAILAEDVQKGLRFAVATTAGHRPLTSDHLDAVQAYLNRVRELVLAKCAEAATVRFLRAHGVNCLPANVEASPELMALRIKKEVVLIRPYHFADEQVQAADILRAYALLWNGHDHDEWRLRHQVDRLIFAYTSGRLWITLQQDLSTLLKPSPSLQSDHIHLSTEALQVFLAAAPSVQECEQSFRQLPAGKRCLPFQNGLPYPAMGCPVRRLTAFRRVVEWGGV